MKWLLAGILIAVIFTRDCLNSDGGRCDDIYYAWNIMNIVGLTIIGVLAYE